MILRILKPSTVSQPEMAFKCCNHPGIRNRVKKSRARCGFFSGLWHKDLFSCGSSRRGKLISKHTIPKACSICRLGRSTPRSLILGLPRRNPPRFVDRASDGLKTIIQKDDGNADRTIDGPSPEVEAPGCRGANCRRWRRKDKEGEKFAKDSVLSGGTRCCGRVHRP